MLFRSPPGNEFWYDIDGFPDLATWVNDAMFAEAIHEATNGRHGGGYLGISLAKRIEKLPRDFFSLSPLVAKYKLILLWPQNHGGQKATAYYFGVSNCGKVVGCQCRRDNTNNTEVVAMFGASVLNNFTDRKHLWNVTAVENGSKAIFGVYPEQIKSLLYARDLPVSATGRKRPILHWVAAHRRRIKAGIDIDISKHLRGISELEMNGLRFQITRPLRVVSPANPQPAASAH